MRSRWWGRRIWFEQSLTRFLDRIVSPAMRSRALRLALLFFQALWLNVVLPGHQRGALTLPGTDECDSCERVDSRCTHCYSQATETQKKHLPTPGEKARCALCFFAARLTVPGSIDLSPPPHRFVKCVAVPRPGGFDSAEYFATYLGRAPPVAA